MMLSSVKTTLAAAASSSTSRRHESCRLWQRTFFSAWTRTRPVNAKVHLQAKDWTHGTVRHVLSVGTRVERGNVIALIRPLEGDDIAIEAPTSGRIAEWYISPSNEIQVGDAMVEIVHDDEQAWKDHLTNHNNNSNKTTMEFLQQNYTHREDIARLEQLIETMRPPPQQQPAAGQSAASTMIPLFQRLLELQILYEYDLVAQAQTHTDWGVFLFNHRVEDLKGALEQFHKALQLRQEFYGSKSHPHIAASHIHLGAIYKQAGQLPQALEHMQTALQLQIQDFGTTVNDRIAVGYSNIGTLHFQIGNMERAKEMYLNALQIYESLTTTNNKNDEATTTKVSRSDVAGTHHNLGIVLKHLRDYDQAGQHLQRALEIRLQVLADTPPDNDNNNKTVAAAMDDAATSHFAVGQWYSEQHQQRRMSQALDKALHHFQSALKIQQALYGKDTPIIAANYNTVGGVYYQKGDYNSALLEYRKALDVLRQNNNDKSDYQQQQQHQHRDDVLAATLHNIGLALYQLGEFHESLKQHQQGRQVLEKLYGKDHFSLATTIKSIGNVHASLKQWDDAMTEYRTAQQILVQHLGSDHFEVASSFNDMGLVYSQLPGKSDEALEAYQAAARIFGSSLGSHHPNTGSCHFNVGLVWKSKGNTQQAKQAFQNALDIWQASLGAEHPNTAMAAERVQECSK